MPTVEHGNRRIGIQLCCQFPDHGFKEGKQVGFLAQNVQEVLPELVSEGSDGYLGVDYSRLTPVLVEARKEQQARIDQLEAIVEKLVTASATTR